MENMERVRKRKSIFSSSDNQKKQKNDSSLIINLQLLLLHKSKENEKLNISIKSLERKIKKIEKYNDDLRTKNSKLENELLEQDNNKICEKIDELEVGKSKDYTFSYIN